MLWQPTRGILQAGQHWRRGQGAPAGGFPSLSGTVLARYTAKAGVTLSGADVTQWADQSGNGAHLITPFGLTMTYGATSFNSRPGITGGPDKYMVTNNHAIATGGAVSMTFWIVLYPLGNAVNARYISTIDSTVSGPDYAGGTAGVVLLANTGGAAAYAGGNHAAFSMADNAHHRVTMVFDGNADLITSYRNGVQQAQTSTVYPQQWGNVGVNLLTLGVSTSMYNNSSGDHDIYTHPEEAAAIYAEIVMMTGAASAGDLSAMDAYFQSEWGL